MIKNKISILTQPLGHNYGGLLQAYALQVYLIGLGYEVETLDRRAPTDKALMIREYMFNVVRFILGRIKTIPTSRRQAAASKKLREFKGRKLAMSPRISSEEQIRNYFRSKDFYAVIVGSDQVWRPRYSPSILNFYLDFLCDIGSSPKRLAYGVSFGVNDWEYNEELSERCRYLARKFDAVSVRESSAVDLCKNKFGVSAQWVVDPTLLLEPEDYNLLIKEDTEISKNGQRCLLSYVLDGSQEKRLIAAAIGEALDVNVFTIKPELPITQVSSKDIKKCELPSVERWLKSFQDACFVVTDSFHGTIFSILFNKPFVVIGNADRGMARFESLLSQFDLLDRMIKSCDEVTPELICRPIDWKRVNEKRGALAAESKEFIKTNLLGK